MIGPASLLDRLDPGIESETFAADPLGCRIALRVLELLDDTFMQKGMAIGHALRSALRPFCESNSIDLEGEGCMAALHFLPKNGILAEDRAWRFARSARDHGVLVHRTGPDLNRVILLPPLNLSEPDLRETIQRLEGAFRAIGSNPQDAIVSIKDARE